MRITSRTDILICYQYVSERAKVISCLTYILFYIYHNDTCEVRLRAGLAQWYSTGLRAG
jgi:hypothetical protein